MSYRSPVQCKLPFCNWRSLSWRLASLREQIGAPAETQKRDGHHCNWLRANLDSLQSVIRRLPRATRSVLQLPPRCSVWPSASGPSGSCKLPFGRSHSQMRPRGCRGGSHAQPGNCQRHYDGFGRWLLDHRARCRTTLRLDGVGLFPNDIANCCHLRSRYLIAN